MTPIARTQTVSRPVAAAKAGHDIVSSQKDLTVVMVPYEHPSALPAAVDDLYRKVTVPFNLIVVEGHSPDPVRSALEDRQKERRNMMIIYTHYEPSACEAFNLAAPHIKTPYAVFMDASCRLLTGGASELLKTAKTGRAGIICAGNSAPNGPKGIGLRYAFLATREALERLGEFDDDMNVLNSGIDLGLAANAKGIRFYVESRPWVRFDPNDPPTLVGELARNITQRLEWARRNFEGLFGSGLPVSNANG